MTQIDYNHSASKTTLVSAHDISIKLGRRKILDRVSIGIHAGEIMTLVGLNGAGKSTLVRAFLGISPLNSGKIVRAEGIRIGYAPQHIHRNAILPMTVKRFLRLGGPATRESLESIMGEVGAGAILDTAVSDISGGELNRVLLARALLRNPHLLVLDEPFANVDANGQVELYGLVKLIRDRHGCGVLIVTHDLHFVVSGTDKLICLGEGDYCVGAPKDIFGHPLFINVFGSGLCEQCLPMGTKKNTISPRPSETPANMGA